ncbi:MAG: hypothetical protein ACI9WU_005389, partial [Myxococcota bacterium]
RVVRTPRIWLVPKRRCPLIAMKRVEGSVWQPTKLSLDENLEVLLDVCHAVHFAHSRASCIAT